jgi:hypothetical protein
MEVRKVKKVISAIAEKCSKKYCHYEQAAIFAMSVPMNCSTSARCLNTL